MLRTAMCEVLGVDHPVALGGMPLVYNSVELTATVSEAGGIGIVGCTYLDPDEITGVASLVRGLTDRPFGLNSLLFLDDQEGYEAMLAARPGLISLSWPRKDQKIESWVDAAHEVGSKVSFMAADIEDAVRGAAAGVDLVVVQGTEGGGHVGWMGLSVLLPMVVDAVRPVPVVAAGGVADGRGLVQCQRDVRHWVGSDPDGAGKQPRRREPGRRQRLHQPGTDRVDQQRHDYPVRDPERDQRHLG